MRYFVASLQVSYRLGRSEDTPVLFLFASTVVKCPIILKLSNWNPTISVNKIFNLIRLLPVKSIEKKCGRKNVKKAGPLYQEVWQ